MLQQAAMVSKMNEKQALGYGVGRLLSTLWNEHLARRHEPNEQKRRANEKLWDDYNKKAAEVNATKQGMADLQAQSQAQAGNFAKGLMWDAPGAGNLPQVTGAPVYTVTQSAMPELVGQVTDASQFLDLNKVLGGLGGAK
jgi:hypothetical protein